MTRKQFTEQIARRAIRLKVGGFRPTDNPLASWFGKVLLARVDEEWPQSNGRPMLTLAQINLNEFPFKPSLVSDIAFLTLFIDADEIPVDGALNGTTWCLRTYQTIDELVPLAPVKTVSPIKPMPMIPDVIEQDFPHYEDCPIEIPVRFEDDYSESFPTADGVKFGGWPTLIQGEIDWQSEHKSPTGPEFAFQIDSIEKAHWQWGDKGVAYFGRTPTGNWAFAWQCY